MREPHRPAHGGAPRRRGRGGPHRAAGRDSGAGRGDGCGRSARPGQPCGRRHRRDGGDDGEYGGAARRFVGWAAAAAAAAACPRSPKPAAAVPTSGTRAAVGEVPGALGPPAASSARSTARARSVNWSSFSSSGGSIASSQWREPMKYPNDWLGATFSSRSGMIVMPALTARSTSSRTCGESFADAENTSTISRLEAMAAAIAPPHSSPARMSRGATQQRTPAASSFAHVGVGDRLVLGRVADEDAVSHGGLSPPRCVRRGDPNYSVARDRCAADRNRRARPCKARRGTTAVKGTAHARGGGGSPVAGAFGLASGRGPRHAPSTRDAGVCFVSGRGRYPPAVGGAHPTGLGCSCAAWQACPTKVRRALPDRGGPAIAAARGVIVKKGTVSGYVAEACPPGATGARRGVSTACPGDPKASSGWYRVPPPVRSSDPVPIPIPGGGRRLGVGAAARVPADRG